MLEENYDDYEEINKEISRVITEMKNKDNDESFQIYNYNQNKSYNYKFVEVKQNFFSSTNNTSYINNINEGKYLINVFIIIIIIIILSMFIKV